MNRKHWAIMIVVGIIAALVASFASLDLDIGKDGPAGGKGNTLDLVRPPIALAQTESSTFPEDEAGLAAYVRVFSSLDLEQAATAFASLVLQGGNWVVGTVPITILPDWDIRGARTIEVPVYIDSEGWVVAYFPRDLFVADMMMWTIIDKENPQLNSITTTTLEEAIDDVLAAAGIDFAPLRNLVGYYDFEFPDAEHILLAARAEETQLGTAVLMDLTIAEGAQVYRVSESVVAESDLQVSPFWNYRYYQGTYCGGCMPWAHHFPVAPYNFPVGSVWTWGFSTEVPEGEVVGMAILVVYSTP